MRNVPEIVKRLREEEKKGSFINFTSSYESNKDGLIFSLDKVPSKKENGSNKDQIKKRYEMILNSTSDLVSIVGFNLKATYEYVSPSHRDLLGYDSEDLIGKSFFDFVHPDDKKNISPILKKYIKMKAKKLIVGKEDKFAENLSYRIRDKKGKWHFLETTANISTNKIIAVSKDVTEQKIARKELKESEIQYRTIFNSSKDVILVFDFEGNIVDANNAALKTYGYSKKEFLKLSGKDIVHNDYHYIFEKFISDVKEKGEFFSESVDIRRDGSTFPVNVKGTSFVLNGEEHLLAIVRDITKHKKDEEKLKKSEEKYKSLFNNAQVGIFRTDLKTGKMLEANNVLADFVGYKNKEELLSDGYNIADHYKNPEDRKKMLDLLKKNGEVQGFEAPFKRLGDSVLWIRFSARISQNKKWIEGVSEDITERKRAEEKIYSLSQIAEQSTDGIIKTDKNFKINYMNPAAEELFGYTFKELKGKKPDIFNAEENSDEIAKEIYDTVSSGEIHFGESLNVRKDGTKFYCQYKVSPLKDDNGKITGYIASQRDITDIKESQKETERFLNAAADGIRIIGKDYKVKKLNQSMADLAGVKKDKAVGMNCREMFGDKNICGTDKCALKRVLKTGARQVLDTNRVTKDGRVIPCLDVVSPWYNEKGVIEDFRDLTDIKDISKKLRESENLFRTLVEQSTVGVYIHDPIDNKVLYANPLIRKILGFSDDEFEKIDLYKYVHPGDLKVLKERTKKRLSGEKIDPSAEIRLIPPNKNMIWVRIYTNFIDYKGTKAALASAIDITESKKANEKIKNINEKLKQKVFERTTEVENLLKQKDEFIGQLGHDLKTPLTPLNTLLPIAQKKIKDEDVKELINVSVENVNYMKNLVSKTLELASLNSPSIEFDFKELNIKEIVEGVLSKNKVVLREQNFSVQNNIDKNINVKGDLLRLEEVLNNLIINSIKYSDDERPGKIVIDAEEKEDFITISLKDFGVGLTPKQISKIFSEFYKTDKARSDFNSTGLGLPICKRIVEKHGGKIWVESSGLGKGSTFYFTLKKSKGGYHV